ncbi:hypothetical protein SRHO_G00344000 [Serrasalmus rhombeus]
MISIFGSLTLDCSDPESGLALNKSHLSPHPRPPPHHSPALQKDQPTNEKARLRYVVVPLG